MYSTNGYADRVVPPDEAAPDVNAPDDTTAPVDVDGAVPQVARKAASRNKLLNLLRGQPDLVARPHVTFHQNCQVELQMYRAEEAIAATERNEKGI